MARRVRRVRRQMLLADHVTAGSQRFFDHLPMDVWGRSHRHQFGRETFQGGGKGGVVLDSYPFGSTGGAVRIGTH
jgi:hypothetical protein